MSLAFDTDVLPLYSTNVSNDANYQAPGNFGIPANYINGTNETRLLTVLEIVRSYMAVISDHNEAKVFRECISHMLAELPTGGGASSYPATTVATRAQKIALTIFAKQPRPITL